ncbi:DUF5763 domain-containing protein [Flavihumibacter sp. RY-1]|jgi:methylphosphotriester-DNA--protein-cysteine methyltransferase|uniref:DUF5763 domain-containing protein n=1 Tax=Flavihumibacter fluminis TaxID=2909236 RepID=A0ABS9BJT0_9BACT|nr:DUF5763 domain-containing protein [Flavihumibacter fluminis]MCF1715964.1 DUF5763 domain-containing protein [Flavihumibacter fluminis]
MIKIIILLLFSYSASSQNIFKTPSGQKYHLETCRMVENVSRQITVAEAQKLGLQPCKICKPKTLSLISTTLSPKSGTQKETVQCKGITKQGNRCKHMTRIGNGYCYQHNPDKN